MVAIEVNTTGGKTLLVNIYAPNGAKDKFLRQLKAKLEDLILIIIGDFNGVLDFNLDKIKPPKSSKLKKKRKSNIFQIFTKFMEQENLLDVWRTRNPQAREYTYYSLVHHSFSRIDLMWANQAILAKTKKLEILPKVKSDHNPIVWSSYQQRTEYKWRLNEDTLMQEKYLNYI